MARATQNLTWAPRSSEIAVEATHDTGGTADEGRHLIFGFFALCMPALADLAAGKQALKNGDYATALKEFLPLAEQGDAEAQFILGSMYREDLGVPQDDKEAVRWYRLAAEQGLALAQCNLGNAYEKGHGAPQDDKEAVRSYRLAAEQGLALAQFNLGVAYEEGHGVPQDGKEAVRWYRLAAEQGLALAQYNLGNMYRDGHGVPQDDKEAVRWYRLAAEQGLADAQSVLGLAYATGHGVPQDDKEAVRWFRLALLRRSHIIANRHRYIGKETSRRWEQGDDISMVDFRCAEYRQGKVIADEELIRQILKFGIRRTARAASVDSKTVMLITHHERKRQRKHTVDILR